MNTAAQIHSPIIQEAVGSIPDDFKAAFDLNFDVSGRIYDIMTRKGVSKQELAHRLKKSPSEVTRWLTGRHNFTVATLAKISLALGEPIISIAG